MPKTPIKSGLRDNHTRGTVADFMKEKIQDASRLSVVSTYFTIYAYDAPKAVSTASRALIFFSVSHPLSTGSTAVEWLVIRRTGIAKF